MRRTMAGPSSAKGSVGSGSTNAALIKGAHYRPGRSLVDHRPPVIAARAGAHRRQRIGVHVRRPQAVEGDEVAVLPVHAGDAGVLVPARAMVGGDLPRHRLALARPRDDPAGIVAV